jgi:hypothetical protein
MNHSSVNRASAQTGSQFVNSATRANKEHGIRSLIHSVTKITRLERRRNRCFKHWCFWLWQSRNRLKKVERSRLAPAPPLVHKTPFFRVIPETRSVGSWVCGYENVRV